MAQRTRSRCCGDCEKFRGTPEAGDVAPLSGVCYRRVECDNLLTIKTAPRPLSSDDLAELARRWVVDIYNACPYHKAVRSDV